MQKSTRGAVSELRVAADLLDAGYEVFRALDPAASCDLVALKDGVCLRVQVRTGHVYEPTGHVWCSRKGEHDLLAIAAPGKIIYEPELN